MTSRNAMIFLLLAVFATAAVYSNGPTQVAAMQLEDADLSADFEGDSASFSEMDSEALTDKLDADEEDAAPDSMEEDQELDQDEDQEDAESDETSFLEVNFPASDFSQTL